MRFILTDNHIVRCENIGDYKEINTGGFCPSVGNSFIKANYKPVFEKIKSFIQRWKGEHEIFTSTLSFLIPGFITELKDYLGTTVKVMPVRALINKPKVREIYDNYFVETTYNTDETFSVNLIKVNLFSSIKSKRMGDWLNGIGIPAVIGFNERIMSEMEDPTPENFELFYVDDGSYKDLLKEKEGYMLFSPYSSLKLVNQLVKDCVSIESLCNTVPSKSTEYSYRLSTAPETNPFNDSWESWVYAEISNIFSVNRFANGKLTKTDTFSIPANIVEESELQVGNLHFGKVFIKIAGDFFGQLHIKVQSLRNNTYYAII